MDAEDTSPDDAPARCAECGTGLDPGQDREVTDDGVFCRSCFNNLTAQLTQVIAGTQTDINYSMALVGAVLGAALGVLAWWGFTVVTEISFGLVAVVIGFAVGKGVLLFSGGKRHLNLQIMSVAVSILGFSYASYLVSRTFILRHYAENGQDIVLPWIPEPALFFNLLQAGFGFMDLIFLALVVYQAWSMTAPIRFGTTR